MTSDQITVTGAWEPSVPEEQAAELFAEGARQWQVAEACKVDIRTVQRWCTNPSFGVLVATLRAEARDKRRAKRERVVSLALDIEAEVLSGKRSPGDPTAKRAAAILASTEYRVYTDDGQPNRGVADRLSATQVNVNIGGDKPAA